VSETELKPKEYNKKKKPAHSRTQKYKKSLTSLLFCVYMFVCTFVRAFSAWIAGFVFISLLF